MIINNFFPILIWLIKKCKTLNYKRFSISPKAAVLINYATKGLHTHDCHKNECFYSIFLIKCTLYDFFWLFFLILQILKFKKKMSFLNKISQLSVACVLSFIATNDYKNWCILMLSLKFFTAELCIVSSLYLCIIVVTDVPCIPLKFIFFLEF